MKLIYRQTSRRALIIGAIILAPLLAVLAAFEWSVIESDVVTSNSMLPTLHKADRVIVDRRNGNRVEVGDIVTFPNPAEPGSYALVKRIIGLEGDEIAVRDGRLYRNGEPWEGPIRLPEGQKVRVQDRELTVPAGHFFAVGDNINYSFDSFHFGPLPLEAIKGQVRLIYWPPGRFGRVGVQPSGS